jgi:hypothetical protein
LIHCPTIERRGLVDMGWGGERELRSHGERL